MAMRGRAFSPTLRRPSITRLSSHSSPTHSLGAFLPSNRPRHAQLSFGGGMAVGCMAAPPEWRRGERGELNSKGSPGFPDRYRRGRKLLAPGQAAARRTVSVTLFSSCVMCGGRPTWAPVSLVPGLSPLICSRLRMGWAHGERFPRRRVPIRPTLYDAETTGPRARAKKKREQALGPPSRRRDQIICLYDAGPTFFFSLPLRPSETGERGEQWGLSRPAGC
jgi:hypothetical protein